MRRIVAILKEEYGSPRLGNKQNPIDELVYILLSEKTDEAKYQQAYYELRRVLPSWEAVRTARLPTIEKAIRCAGMGRRRAKLIREMLRSLVKTFGNLDLSALKDVPTSEAERKLVALPGIGTKAARCVLLYCFGRNVLPVDVHTYRTAVRLGVISRRVSYEKAHAILQTAVPAKLRHAFHVNTVAHGRKRCYAKSPECKGCPVKAFCSDWKAERLVPIDMRPKPIAIEIFAGGGGMSTGFEHAGFRVVGAVEADSRAAATYHRNFKDVLLVQDRVENVEAKKLLNRLGLRRGDLTVLFGGPPCQGFSESNRRTRTLTNPRNHLYKEFLRLVKGMRPAWFVLENVAGLRTLAEGEILQAIIDAAKTIGYKVGWKELNSADFGVPQVRRRVFVIGNRFGLPIRFPEPTHGPDQEPYVSVWDAISDLPRLENGALEDHLPYRAATAFSSYQEMMRSKSNGMVQGHLVTHNAENVIKRYKYIKPGENWEAIPRRLLKNYEDCSRCHTGIYYRLKRGEPSKVIGNFRKNMLIHPTQNRGLSVREAARLQSFPDVHEFLGSIGFQQQQVADAVPPLLALAVAATVLKTCRESCTISIW